MGTGLLLGTMAALAVVWLLWRLRHGRQLANRGRKRTRTEVAPIDLAASAGARRCRPKPKWVAGAVIRLCALMPHDGCRKIAATFNRAHSHRGETVGKSYVASLAKRRALAILSLRRKLKNRATHPGPRNLTWAADLTFLPNRPQPAPPTRQPRLQRPDLLRVWYNHVRPHQGLRGQVPGEVWDPGRRGALRVFEAWGGLLSGHGRST